MTQATKLELLKSAFDSAMQQLPDCSALQRHAEWRIWCEDGFAQHLHWTEIETFRALLEQRVTQRMPIQYLVETAWFYGLPFRVTPAVLIPRPETELLVEGVLERLLMLQPEIPIRLVDVGTGSGCIAVALADQLRQKSVAFELLALDNSPEALAIAQHNLLTHELQDHVQIRHSHWLSALANQNKYKKKYTAIISNPPYISNSANTLEKEVLHEPHGALLGNPTEVYPVLMTQAAQHLIPNGLLALEFGVDTCPEQLCQWATTFGFSQPVIQKDYSGLPRMFYAKYAATN